MIVLFFFLMPGYSFLQIIWQDQLISSHSIVNSATFKRLVLLCNRVENKGKWSLLNNFIRFFFLISFLDNCVLWHFCIQQMFRYHVGADIKLMMQPVVWLLNQEENEELEDAWSNWRRSCLFHVVEDLTTNKKRCPGLQYYWPAEIS